MCVSVFREVAPGRPDPRACKGGAIDVNTQTLGIPILVIRKGRPKAQPYRRLGLIGLTRGASGLHVAQLRRN